jgi:protein-tyrosine phosphatase
VIDLHSHILPGLDDGPADVEGSLALARAAVQSGTTVIAATPHIRQDFPFPIEAVAEGTEQLNGLLAEEGLDLRVVAGGEVAITKVAELSDEELRVLCLGEGPYLLVESPYTHAPQLVEALLAELQSRGFRPILAHPERSPTFLTDFIRLQRLVEAGVLCSVTALSMAGWFGTPARRFSAAMFAAGLVHDVASDAHDEQIRPPGLLAGFERLEDDMPGLAAQSQWFTREVPQAVLTGSSLPPHPEPVSPAPQGWRRLLRPLTA